MEVHQAEASVKEGVKREEVMTERDSHINPEIKIAVMREMDMINLKAMREVGMIKVVDMREMDTIKVVVMKEIVTIKIVIANILAGDLWEDDSKRLIIKKEMTTTDLNL